MCFTCPKYLSLPLWHPSSAGQTPLSKTLCQQLDGTKGLTFVPTYRLLSQVSDFARNVTGSGQRCRAKDPLFSWSRSLCLLLVPNVSPESTGVAMAPGSLAVP